MTCLVNLLNWLSTKWLLRLSGIGKNSQNNILNGDLLHNGRNLSVSGHFWISNGTLIAIFRQNLSGKINWINSSGWFYYLGEFWNPNCIPKDLIMLVKILTQMELFDFESITFIFWTQKWTQNKEVHQNQYIR